MECQGNCAIPKILYCAIDYYRTIFHCDPHVASFAPGRVNLIGEHTDYNDGFVLPIALPMGTVMIGAKNDSNSVHIVSKSDNIGSQIEVKFDLPENGKLQKGEPKWANYVKGVISYFKGEVKEGFNAAIVSSVPVGGGLSSSAALEVATYVFLEALTEEYNKDLKDKALRCQKAEHDYADMPCGIMDQFISIMGEKGRALLLDCRSMEVTMVPLQSDSDVILITNSNVKHELSSSEYPVRRKQCEQAAEILGVKSLRDVNNEKLESNKSSLPVTVYKRARHVVSEIARTTQAAQALKINDFATFGKLMVESHNSLKDDYEVSCPELNQLVSIAIACDGVYGSRMTGGGFGGCTVTLLKQSAVDLVIKNIKNKYDGTPTFYIASASQGARDITPLLEEELINKLFE
uniref:Galactokinase n=1 Tax=Triatoma infestans TaxID=30076 RepID=A0A023F7V3_TRIIF